MSENNGNTPTVKRQLYVKKGVQFGKVHIEFGVTEAFEFSNAQEQHAAYKKLLDICEFEIAQYAEDFKRTPQDYGQRADAPPPQNPASGAITELVTEIVLSVQEGKPMYKAKTPSNPKWGVPIYEDMQHFELVKQLLNGGYSVKPDKYTVTHVPQGKGRKVIALEVGF